jgi:hypothetical protein
MSARRWLPRLALLLLAAVADLVAPKVIGF